MTSDRIIGPLARVGEPDIEEQLRRRNRELEILNRISEALNRSTDVHTALESTLALVADLLGLRSAWVWLLDSDERPYLAASLNLPPFLRQPEQMEGWLCHCLRTFLKHDMEGAANVNVIQCSRLARAVTGSEGLRYHASIPLYLGEKRVGVMNVAGPDWRRLGPEDLRLLNTIGNQVAVAVERSRLAEERARAARLEERNRLAREIHDTLAQNLAGISLYLETADALLPEHPSDARRTVLGALEMAREGLSEARRSVQDLRAAPLEGRTLSEALHELAARFAHQTGIETHAEIRMRTYDLPSEVESDLYRIAQEALTNVRKHAGARRAGIGLRDEDGVVLLEIRDDGRGFAPEPEEASQGFGLMGMRERAEQLGGSFEVGSAEGSGTTVSVRVPVRRRPFRKVARR